MESELSTDVAQAVQPVFAVLSPGRAMGRLVVASPNADPTAIARIEEAAADPILRRKPELLAGLWLLADELDRSHTVSQGIDTPTGSFWHAIMHRREGDFSNSKYWYRRAGQHPAMAAIQPPDAAAFDPFVFVDKVEQASNSGNHGDDALVQLQRAEWQALFAWCAEN